MSDRRTDVGREMEAALKEVLAHVRGTTPLPCRIVNSPAAERIRRAKRANEAKPTQVRGQPRA